MKKIYREDELVKLAKRDNNKKRAFLLVNPLQGKHIPVSPRESLGLFRNLARKLQEKYPKDKMLIVGFAETATAIGAAIAVEIKENTWYIQTTRESRVEDECLFFSEVHSHATEQKLVINGLSVVLEKIDRIVFAEDEVTTGNTILNLKRVIEDKYGVRKIKFSVISVLNGMTEENIEEFNKEKIENIYINKIYQKSYEEKLSQYSYNENSRYSLCVDENEKHKSNNYTVKEYIDSREVVDMKTYKDRCRNLIMKIMEKLDRSNYENKSVLVLGTEEFMYPAMLVAEEIECKLKCKEVKFHATTRSPILPSDEEDYPLNSRYELRSFYSSERVIYLYNLKRYDKVIIIHDSNYSEGVGIESLKAALIKNKCKEIIIFQWGD